MSFVKIWVHLVFSTRNRDPNLTRDIRYSLIEHINSNAKEKDIYLRAINGWTEHIHCLISLGKNQEIAKVAMLIKGESAHWLNQQHYFKGKFHWQDDYFAVSVSESMVEKVESYIKKQEEHHTSKPFSEELEFFARQYKW
jgi:putative transposase